MHTSSTRAPRPFPMPDCIALPPDDSLRDWGAQIGNPPEPTQLLVWKGEQFPGAEKHVEEEGWWDGEVYFAGNCLSSTEPGSRAAIYQTREGITAMWDFSGPALPVEGSTARMAAGIYRPLPRPITRAELIADQALTQRFKSMVAKGALTRDQGQAIDRLVRRDGLPCGVRFLPPPWATWPQPGLDWTMDPDADWGREHPIQMAVALSPALWGEI